MDKYYHYGRPDSSIGAFVQLCLNPGTLKFDITVASLGSRLSLGDFLASTVFYTANKSGDQKRHGLSLGYSYRTKYKDRLHIDE